MRIPFLLFLSATLLCFSTQSAAHNRDCVILLHGLARTNLSMFKLSWALKNHHYIVINDTYPSTQKSVADIANHYLPKMVDKCLQYQPQHIHFVTHSIGGIILQDYLKNHEVPHMGNIVMLAPPNQGSPWADHLSQRRFFRFILGPATSELTTKRQTPQLSSQYNIGIIAGSTNLNPFLGMLFHEPNDGKVSVASTKMKAMKDFIVLPVNHTFIMLSGKTERQILYFLDHSTFMKNG